MKHVIITGGAGFIGSHLSDALLKRGYAVTAIDNLLTGRRSNLEDALGNDAFSFLEWDICQPLSADARRKMSLLQKHGLHGLFHFACPASPVDFERLAFEILAVDSVGTMHTVNLALEYQARYVLASTSEIYGDPLVHPQNEEYWGNVSTTGVRACYDETKRFAEAYVSTAIRKASPALNAAMVRIFNTYGPRMRPDDGRIVPEFCRQAIRGEPITVHGDGKQTRSFCYVSDLVEGVIRLFESDYRGPMNIGSPAERTVLQFAEAVLKHTDGRSPVRFLPVRSDDPKQRCPDIARARKTLGWAPQVELEEGLRRSLEYFRSCS